MLFCVFYFCSVLVTCYQNALATRLWSRQVKPQLKIAIRSRSLMEILEVRETLLTKHIN